MESETAADLGPLSERISEVYWLRVRDTGLGVDQARAMREELGLRVADCIAHFAATAPTEVDRVEESLARYDRLREAAGVDRRLLEEPSRLLPGPLGPVQAVTEAVLGAVPALIGFVTGIVPWTMARALARGGAPYRHPAGVAVFAAFHGALVALVAWQFSTQATVATALLLLGTGPLALAYLRRMRTVVAHVGGRTASWLELGTVREVCEAQDELVSRLDHLRNRYRKEALGLPPLPPRFRRRSTAAALTRLATLGAATAVLVLFAWAWADRPVRGLPLGPSPWLETRVEDPAEAERQLLRDAEGVLLAAEQLDRMQGEMARLRAAFLEGERSFLSQEDHDATRALLLAYLDLRSSLLKTVWLYRGDNGSPAEGSADALERRAFLTAYAAATLLVEKAWVLYETFREDETTMRQLDLGDLSWGIPQGVFSALVESLTNASVMAELSLAVRRFDTDRAGGDVPDGDLWSALARRAEGSRPAVDAAMAGVGTRRLERTLREMARQLTSPAEELTPAVSMAVSRFRFKERPPHRGLISAAQLASLRAELRPGDILVERRNWYISNSLLPGFWPHAALYLGSYEELEALGVTADPRARPHMDDFRGSDGRGDAYAVIEAIGEGVIFTSFEQSVGEADAVAVLRPMLEGDEMREALSRALSHRGKEYDFDFDFETTDRLVCTELVFRAYDGILEIPEMRSIMGKPRIAASDYVRMWAEGRDEARPQLELVRFLDFDEPNGVSVEADAETLVTTLDRSRFTFLN